MKWFSEKTDVGTLLSKRQYGRAIKMLEKQLRDDPESVSLRLQLADALERDGQKKQAIAILAKLVDELTAEGFVAKAIALLKKIQRIDPSLSIEDKLGRILPEPVEGTSRLVAPKPQQVEVGEETTIETLDSFGSVITSEVVLADTWLGDVERRDDFHWSALTRGLSDREVVELFSNIRLIVKRPGAIIYTEGEPGDSFYVLAQGRARSYKRDSRGHNRQIAVLRSGDFFGTRIAVGDVTRIRTVTAADDCEILEIDKESFERLAQRRPQLREQVMSIASQLEAD
ncbi:MAG: cyclic nucleotide-binding domain-containing protein [Acidobacteriota bacterium]